MIRIVIDPNIIASVLLGGLTRGRYRWLLDNLVRFEICYSDLLTDEIERFGNAPYFQQKGVSKEEIRSFLNTFRSVRWRRNNFYEGIRGTI